MSSSPAARLAGRSLYLCVPLRPALERFVAECIAGGVDVVQLREKDADARQVIGAAAGLAQLCSDLDVPFLINDRPDIALEVDADGCHVGQDDVPPSLCRRILGPHRIVGLSTHRPDELAAAAGEPVDYVAAGPVVPTPTKPGRPGTGLAYVAAAAAAAASWHGEGRSIPLFITGGVTPEAIPGLVAAGARGFVVVRYLTESDHPRAAARRLREAIDAAIDEAPGRGLDAV